MGLTNNTSNKTTNADTNADSATSALNKALSDPRIAEVLSDYGVAINWIEPVLVSEHHSLTQIPKSKAFDVIREQLPAEHAFAFFYERSLLQAVAIDQETPATTAKLKAKFGDNRELINTLANTYIALANTFFHENRRLSWYKTEIVERSLLSLLTDGESHRHIYPDVDFDIDRAIAPTKEND